MRVPNIQTMRSSKRVKTYDEDILYAIGMLQSKAVAIQDAALYKGTVSLERVYISCGT
jgi:hypothetical protein